MPFGKPNAAPVATPVSTYTPPDLKDLYEAFRSTGNVPYSYYGVSAPTRKGELDLVRKSYPGAFSPGSAAAPEREVDPLAEKLLSMGPLGAIFSGMYNWSKSRGG